MANRSDFNSVLPRSIKKMLTMASIRQGWTKAEAREARLDFIAAHTHHKRIRQMRLSSKSEEITEATPEA